MTYDAKDGGGIEPEAVTPYDSVPYRSLPFAQTHPDRLAAVARVFGLHSPDVTRCRVLDLGCASGGNLAPMAVNLPESTLSAWISYATRSKTGVPHFMRSACAIWSWNTGPGLASDRCRDRHNSPAFPRIQAAVVSNR